MIFRPKLLRFAITIAIVTALHQLVSGVSIKVIDNTASM